MHLCFWSAELAAMYTDWQHVRTQLCVCRVLCRCGPGLAKTATQSAAFQQTETTSSSCFFFFSLSFAYCCVPSRIETVIMLDTHFIDPSPTRLCCLWHGARQIDNTETDRKRARTDTLDRMYLIRCLDQCAALLSTFPSVFGSPSIRLRCGQGRVLLWASHNQWNQGLTEQGGVARFEESPVAQRNIIKAEATWPDVNKP